MGFPGRKSHPDRRLLHTPYSETLAAGVERNVTFKYRIETANTGKAAESVGFVPAVEVEVPSDAALGVFQRENVDHGLRPLPFLRDTGRCRVLGIHIEGARHPSSERNKNRKSSEYSQRPGPIAVGTYDAGSSLHPLLRKALRSSLLFEQGGTATQRMQSSCAYTIVGAIGVTVNSILCETPSLVTSIDTASFELVAGT
jgi:hypothetical protein